MDGETNDETIQITDNCNYYWGNNQLKEIGIKFTLGSLLSIVLMFMTKTKNIKCCCGCFGVLVPVKFLEDKENRLMILSVFTIASKEVYQLLFDNQIEVNIKEPLDPYQKQFLKIFQVLLNSVAILPLLVTSTTTGSIFHFIIGILYTAFIACYEIFTNFPICDEGLESPDGVVSLVISILAITACIILVVNYIIKIYSTSKSKKAVSCKLAKSNYHVMYVRQLFNSKEIINEEKNFKENFFSKHIYKNIKGFRYSITFQLSIYVGCVIVFMLTLGFYIGINQMYQYLNKGMQNILQNSNVEPSGSATHVIVKAAQILFRIKAERLQNILKKKISWLEFANLQLQLIFGCLIFSITCALLIIILTVLHMIKSYRKNILDMNCQRNNKHVINLDEISISNVNIIVSSIQFAGYQVAHIIWGFLIQFLVLSLFSIIASEIVVIPFTISFIDFFLALLDYFGPIILVLILTIVIQWLLVRYFFVQNKGKVLAIDNRRYFYNLMYFMFFYNILTGIFTTVIRILKSIVFDLLLVPRLDSSVFPRYFEKFDTGFKAYSCLLKMEALQSNSILVVFIAIVNSRIKLKKKMIMQLRKSGAIRYQRRNAAVHRWFLAWTLMHNKILVFERKLKNKSHIIRY